MGPQDNLDLPKAFRRVDSDRRDDAFPDIVGYRDYKKGLEVNLSALRERIKDFGKYKADLPLSIDLPKRGFTLRPGLVPLIDDRITYQAIADLLSKHFSSEPNVYSNRLARPSSNRMFIQGVELWIAFQNKVEEYCHQYPFVVETDITAYFDHINHELMLSRISDLFSKSLDQSELKTVKELLYQMWGRWNVGYLKHFGIPQINDASSFMSNLYLDELDKWLLSHKFIYLRYVDDIRIFANSEPEARKSLADLIVKMREMGLYVASGKTKIQKSADVIGELSKGRNQIKEIETEIDSGNSERMNLAAEKLKSFFLQLVGEPQDFNDRLFRFCIHRFKKLQVTGLGGETQDRVISEVLSRLITMPESTDVFVDYLSLFKDNEFIQFAVLNFLESQNNIYAWQEMLLLELLVRLNITKENLVRSYQYANSVIAKNKHPACKARAYVFLGKHGSYAERRDIRSRYHQEKTKAPEEL
jgi:Retron-type reverse transcriptase